MPSTAVSYHYTLLSLFSVGAILVCSFQIYNYRIQGISETTALTRILEGVAAEGCELLSLVSATNSSAQLLMHFPSRIGGKLYWLRLRSSSSATWLEGGFGEEWNGEPECKVYLPRDISVSGSFAGEEGTLRLLCYIVGSEPHLELSVERGG